jgi:hypothetical protein
MLGLLNLPADTPIQRTGVPMPQVQAKFDDEASDTLGQPVQRAVEIEEMSSNISTSDSAGGKGGKSEENVKQMAEQVYQIIKRRLKTEQERLRGKK